MNSSGSGKKPEGFFAGKGFYIVLFLCATVIGVSAWMMAAGNEAMESINEMNSTVGNRIETVIITPDARLEAVDSDDEENLNDGFLEVQKLEETETAEVWNETDVPEADAAVYVWPVQGELERYHDVSNLSYDVTLRDWRTHEGVDIAAPLGETVFASHAGTVESVAEDELYGTVVTVNHGDGAVSLYANLASMPAVNVGDTLNAGDVIGSVGTTALCEIGQGTHLHFAMYLDGESVDPLNYLPA